MTFKQEFFNLVDEKKATKEVVNSLLKLYNHLVFTADEATLKAHEQHEQHYINRLNEIDSRLEELRSEVSREQLLEMRAEYYNK